MDEKLKKLIEKHLKKSMLHLYYQPDGKFSDKKYKGKLVFMPSLLPEYATEVPALGYPPVFLIDEKSGEISDVNHKDDPEVFYDSFWD